MSLFNKIFSEQDNLSQQEIKDYVSAKAGSDNYSIEKKSLDNELNSDALDGFTENPDKLININTIQTQAFSSVFKTNLSPIIFTSLLVIIITFTIFYVAFTNKKTNKITEIKTTNETIIKQLEPIAEPVNIELESEINNIVAENKKSPEFIRENEYIPLIKSKDLSKLEVKINEKIEDLKNHINFNTRYIADLKVVDYSKTHRENNLNKSSIDIWNVEPSYSNKQEQKAGNSGLKSIEYSYFEFLESSLKRFNKGKYFLAIENFDLILQQYDNDLNALFYSGLSYYYIGDYNKAIKYFDKVINNEINVFYEESLWFKALSYKKTNPKKAKELFKKIVNEKGFYCKKAKIEISN